MEGLALVSTSLGVVFFAGLLRGFTGFGAVLLIVPAFAILHDARSAVPTGLFMDLVAGLLMLPKARHQMDWSTILPMGGAALVAVPVGTMLLAGLDPDLSRRMIAVLVIVFAAILASGWRYRGAINRRTSAVAGAVCGILTGATGLGGPPAVVFVLSGTLNAAQARASLTGLFLAMTLFALVNLTLHGMINEEILLRIAYLAPAFMAGIWIGSSLFQPTRESLYRKVALGSLAFMSLLLLMNL